MTSSSAWLLAGSALALAIANVFVPSSVQSAPLPGTPLGGKAFGSVEIVDGLNVLPGPVVPGDVVLRENPSGGDSRNNWSNVVRYFNYRTAYNGTIGIAYQISDGETGIPRIDILDENLSAIRPDAISTNNQFINEIQIGTGTEADVTQYVTSNASYNVHSDAAHPELPEVFPPAPGQLIGLPGGGKGWVLYHLVEGRLGIPDFDRLMSVKAALVLGPVVVPDSPLDPIGGLTDIITVTPDPNNPAFSTVTLNSPADENQANPSPPLSDLEWVPAIQGDESGVAFLIEGHDVVPEPGTWALLLIGAGAIGCALRRRRDRTAVSFA